MNDLIALCDWLENKAEDLMKNAIARRESERVMRGLTRKELVEAKRMAEQMVGRKLPGAIASVSDNKRNADIQIRIAEKYEAESRQLSAWADSLRKLLGEAQPNVGATKHMPNGVINRRCGTSLLGTS